jgi:hypothetical protein
MLRERAVLLSFPGAGRVKAEAEAAASGAPRPPEITPLDRYSLVVKDNNYAARWLAERGFSRH